jgi:phage regulator Rha-like protein
MNITFANPSSTTQSMNSQQIADIVSARHSNVKRTIDRLIDQGVISQPPMENGIKSANGVIPQLYVFSGEQGKLDSITVVAQLCPHFTAMIVQRWQQLERVVSSESYQQLITQNQALRDELLRARPHWGDVIHYKNIGLGTSEVARLIDRSNSTVNTYIRAMQSLGYGIANEPQPAQLTLEV